jgi:glycosyltransferase involved in cell wall biosynthesis
MRVAYVTSYDARDVRQWSGLGHYIARALEGQGLELEYIGPLRPLRSPWLELRRAFYRLGRGRHFHRERHPRFLRYYAEQVDARLKESRADVIFSPGTLPIACLRDERPVVFWADATFAGMLDYYRESSRLCAETIAQGCALEQAVLNRCRLALYASEWAAATARDHYRVDPAKVNVVPFGANLDGERTQADVRRLIASRPRDVCRLLLLGVDWHRKGGDLAVALAERLNREGTPATLTVAGCRPPGRVPDCVELRGMISKAAAAGRRELDELLARAHFLVFPSRAECYGVAIPEANSFGVPALATRVGGIPTAVRDGVNGRLFPLEGFVEQAAGVIARLMRAPAEYEVLAEGAFGEYNARLNWRAAGKTVRTLLEAACR